MKRIIRGSVMSSKKVKASNAIDNSEREFQRIDRSGTDEEVKLAAIMYNLGATLDEAREILPTVSEEKIKEYIDYYNLRDLPRSKRVEIWNKRKVTSATEDEIDEADEEEAAAQFEKLVNGISEIGNYSKFVSTLKQLNENQRKLFMEFFGDVNSVKPGVAEKGIPVTKLRPTQSEIDWKKSLSYGLKQDCSYFFKGSVTLGMPVLTFRGTYIIDGHHRWSQVFMFNPKGNVSCIDFNYDEDNPIDVLKDFQAAVLAEKGQIDVGTAGTNIWDVSEGTLRAFITENISDACWQSLVKAGVAEDKESAINYIVNNALTLQESIVPAKGAPDRVDMPQTNEAVIKRAAGALTRMSAATEPTSRKTVKYPKVSDEDREAVIEFAHDCYETGHGVEDYNEFAEILRDQGMIPSKALYQIYLDNYNDGSVEGASYGGAFDIEDDQYFTKDDIVEFGNHVCDHLNETFNDTYDIADVYMETPKKLVLTVMQKSDGSEFSAEVDIDMRRIRKPSDLVKSYWGDVVYALRQEIEAYNNEINSCDTITAAQKTGADWIKTKVWNAIVAKLEDDGWEADDINDYVFVDVKQTDENIKVEVRAELSYEGLEDLISAIDPIVQEWDPNAYFEPVEPGIAEAYIWNFDKVNSSSDTEDTSEWYVGDSESGHMYKGKKTAEAALARLKKSGVEDAVMMPAEDESVQSAIKAGIYDVPERPLDPPEDDSWEEIDSDDEIVEITLDAIVHIDEDGSWEYDDTNYPWAASPDNKRGDWYTEEYDVYLGDKTSMVEYVDELLESMMPVTPGEYHIKGDVTLVFSVSGIEVKRDYFWDERHGADYDEEAYTDNAETEFLYDKSYIKNFEITER